MSPTQPVFTCSKLTIETLEQRVFTTVKGYLRYKIIFCYKVAFDE